jgi:sulfite reductase (ferredoxin)
MNLGATPSTEWPRLSDEARAEIDVFETELHRFLDKQVPDKVFLEFRLRHGVYGQRQPAVQMQRIKIPLGRLTAEQCETLAGVAEEYSDAICHVTTRQDIQLHFVNILDTPNLFRRLASAGITTREACGNTVRNVTACPYAGVCGDETFDVTPHARAMAYFLLRHPDAQNFGRKFKIAFSGCAQHHCGLARMHDIGAIARERLDAGRRVQGFEVYVGGGLGAVPHQARLFDEFVPAEEMLPLAQAISRVFARLGEKKSRARARMKFLVANLGIDEFRRIVLEERERLPEDPCWSEMLSSALREEEKPLKPPSTLDPAGAEASAELRTWLRANVRPQRQAGYSVATVFLPLGDITSDQLRGLAQVSRRYIRDSIRTTVAQNLILRWVANGDLPALHRDLQSLRLAMPLAGTVADITACPGTDSCKLGIASSRGLAAVLQHEFLEDARGGTGMSDAQGGLRDDIKIKISGCFNSCGQHHIANIGFFGTSKRKGNRVAPLFQVLLGGAAEGNAASYALMVAKVPAHHAPEAVRRLTRLYDAEKQPGEGFNDCMARLGKARVHQELLEISEIGEGEEFFHDNRQPWEYVKHVEQGECAGEVVDQAEFLLEDAERMIFDATLQLEAELYQEAGKVAFESMKKAADGLLSTRGLLLSDRYDTIAEFRARFAEPGNFFPGCADYLFKAAAEGEVRFGPERARQIVEEANLFIEEAHVVYSRMAGSAVK